MKTIIPVLFCSLANILAGQVVPRQLTETPETQSAFLKSYSPDSTIARFQIEGSGAQQSAPGGSTTGRGCVFNEKEFIELFVIASGNRVPLMLDVQRDIKSSLALQGGKIVRQVGHAPERFQFDYAAGQSRGTVVVEPLFVVDPKIVEGPYAARGPAESAVKLHIRLTETWYKASDRACEKL
jgi:hypothetical protein